MPMGGPNEGFASNYGYGGMPGTTTGMALGGYAATGNPQIGAQAKYQQGALNSVGLGSNYNSANAPALPLNAKQPFRGKKGPKPIGTVHPKTGAVLTEDGVKYPGEPDYPYPGMQGLPTTGGPYGTPTSQYPGMQGLPSTQGPYGSPPISGYSGYGTFNGPYVGGMPGGMTSPSDIDQGHMNDFANSAANSYSGPGSGWNGIMNSLGMGRQFGGPVAPGGQYTVGENGPETLQMNATGGGQVIPNNPMDKLGGMNPQMMQAMFQLMQQQKPPGGPLPTPGQPPQKLQMPQPSQPPQTPGGGFQLGDWRKRMGIEGLSRPGMGFGGSGLGVSGIMPQMKQQLG